jgi:hypothetical protein
MRDQKLDSAEPGPAIETPLGALETEDARQPAVSSKNRCGDCIQVALALAGRLRPAALTDPVHRGRELARIGDGPGSEALETPARERNVAEGEKDLPRRGCMRNARAAETRNALNGRLALSKVHRDSLPLAGDRERRRFTGRLHQRFQMRSRELAQVEAREDDVPELEEPNAAASVASSRETLLGFTPVRRASSFVPSSPPAAASASSRRNDRSTAATRRTAGFPVRAMLRSA